jgi:hypothetical protein
MGQAVGVSLTSRGLGALALLLAIEACSSSSPTGGGTGQEDAGKTPTPQDGSTSADTGTSSADTGESCLASGAECTSTPNGCCSGLCDAPTTTTGQAYCAAACTDAAECMSGCCAPVANSSSMACSPRGFCANTCSGASGACTANTDCCQNFECVGTNGGTCAAVCTENSECESGCCAPLTNASVSVCSADQFCE